MSKIYTKTGDQGTTRLVDGQQVSKTNLRVEAYGTIDELNSQIGELKYYLCLEAKLLEQKNTLTQIQNLLFNIGSLCACEDLETQKKLPQLAPEHITSLETAIDRMTEELPSLRNFILPYGHLTAILAHKARTLTRRSERNYWHVEPLSEEDKKSLIYLNRLSDYFFTLARWCNLKMNIPDQIWEK